MSLDVDFAVCSTFESSKDLAEKLVEYAQADESIGTLPGRTLKLRQDPKRSATPDAWFIAPVKDDTAYHTGKFRIAADCPLADTFVAIWFEKGIGPTAESVFEHSDMIMVEDKWIWSEVIRAIDEGEFQACLESCRDRAGVNAAISIYLEEKSPGRGSGGAKQKEFYQYESGELAHLSTAAPGRIICEPKSIATLADMSRALNDIEKRDWTWISLEFGVLINRKDDDKTRPRMDSSTVWNNVCGPYLRWFR